MFEVMDKELTPLQMWLGALGLGALAFAAGRWRRWAGTPFVLFGLFLGWNVVMELRDRDVGPAILHEAGRSYPWQFAGAVILMLGLAASGASRRRR